MQAGDLITDGELWRGIGPMVPPSGQGAPYQMRAEDSRQVAVFSPEAFYDPQRKDESTGQRSLEPSVLVGLMAGPPEKAQQDLRTAGRPCDAIAGIAVADVLRTTVRTSPGSPTANGPGGTLMMMVVFDPEHFTNRDGHEVRLDAHAVIRPQPQWHSTSGPLRRMQQALAILATDYHRRLDWVLPPAA